ncbi:2-aminoethylphosphonate--pyruvate transaminase [Pseudoalteromonas tunicata]|uniref:2-aminoethylphosphonate--pyruvate transaminase n=1 Tax=Pseudoalteromonas tunicata TaxID=314281 RepID=UPI00273EB164|nr:2-aminoethylphosphonate--pyruvate transaminase [Pseudoalteromonas tunicata]MDP5214688.1 2-aminoethylphosphonate--pyruvate transaminase [Pseudoalteromonas tunicata]
MNPYLLLTPGPVSTSKLVKQAMLSDWCASDDNYHQEIVEVIRSKLVSLATMGEGYSSVLMQGTDTASLEACFGTLISNSDKVLIINNGADGKRMVQIAQSLKIAHTVIESVETTFLDLAAISKRLQDDPQITHIAMVHCETATGMLNPAQQVGNLAHEFGKVYFLDAMNTFGGIPFDLADWHVDVMISTASHCIQGVPGVGFVVCKQTLLEQSKGQARALSLDLYEQWHTMHTQQGKWCFNSPTHVVRSFYQALIELEREGGIAARYTRYLVNQQGLVLGMKALGFEPLLPEELHSPIVTAFHCSQAPEYNFHDFYEALKEQGFVIYPSTVTTADCVQIANIGEVYLKDIADFLNAVERSCFWL